MALAFSIIVSCAPSLSNGPEFAEPTLDSIAYIRHGNQNRGAMEGRADKGIIITTGVFTVEAKKEARRDGAKPIELVNGDDLVALFESFELGVTAQDI